jgi:hypothetical protein
MAQKIDVRNVFILLALVIFVYESQRIHTLQLYMEKVENDLRVQSNNSKSSSNQYLDDDDDTTIGKNNAAKSTSASASTSTSASSSNEILKNSNSNNYSWVGNFWIPPKGIPTYSPTDLLEYFSNRNVLFIGDSTARRAWATAYAMMNATDRTDIPVRDLDTARVTEVHKRNLPPDRQCLLDDRGAWRVNAAKKKRSTAFQQFECRDLPKIETMSLGDSEHDGDKTKIPKKGRFDFTFFTCYSQVDWFLRLKEENTLFPNHVKPDYDLIVVALGMWEFVNQEDCDKNSPGDPHKDRYRRMLDTIHKLSSPKLQVVYRTCGYDERPEYQNHTRVKDFEQINRDFVGEITNDGHRSKNPSANFTVVDWASVVSKRSFGEDRIRGDLPPHYGLQGRSLFIQQLVHELKKADVE